MIIQPEARDVALAVAHRFSRIQLQLRRSLCPSSFLLHSIPVCLVSVQPHLLQDSFSLYFQSFIHSFFSPTRPLHRPRVCAETDSVPRTDMCRFLPRCGRTSSCTSDSVPQPAKAEIEYLEISYLMKTSRTNENQHIHT